MHDRVVEMEPVRRNLCRLFVVYVHVLSTKKEVYIFILMYQ